MLFQSFFTPKDTRIYLDHAAATPVRTEVLAVMAPYFSVHYGNPSAIHAEGQHARSAIEDARTTLARILKVRVEDIIFTGSGTESNNLALSGILQYHVEERGKKFEELHVISTKTEHPSILRVLEHLSACGASVDFAAVDEEGRIDVKHFESLFNEQTVLVTFAYANSEIGVVQDVKRLSRIVKKYNTDHKTHVLTHLDASQAPLWLPVEMDMLGVDLMTLDAGKCCGPKGVGVLAKRHDVDLKGVLLGGGQEFGFRAGTENTALIVGCVKAIEVAVREMTSRSAVVAALRDVMIKELLTIPGAILNGSREYRIANNVNISIPGLDSEFAVVTLDAKGIASSTKSACSGKDSSGSAVVREISNDEARARSTIRFSLGETTKRKEIAYATSTLRTHVEKMNAHIATLGR